MHFPTVMRIHEILAWIRSDPELSIRLMDPDPNSDPDPSVNFKTPKKFLLLFFCLSVLFEGTFTSFLKDKGHQKPQNNRNQGFSYPKRTDPMDPDPQHCFQKKISKLNILPHDPDQSQYLWM